MARRKRSAAEVKSRDERALHWRHTNLLRGATSAMTGGGAVEESASEVIASADDPRLSMTARVEAREELLASMGRLDRALRHVAAMEAAQGRVTVG